MGFFGRSVVNLRIAADRSNRIGLTREKGDSPHLLERPEGGHRREALVVAQMGTVPFFPPTGERYAV